MARYSGKIAPYAEYLPLSQRAPEDTVLFAASEYELSYSI
jgi:hypothetical protein